MGQRNQLWTNVKKIADVINLASRMQEFGVCGESFFEKSNGTLNFFEVDNRW